jgi:hypothetical protein
MAKFTFTSEIDGVTVSHSFEAEVLPEIQKRFNDFVEGSGFVLPEEEDSFESRITANDFLAKEEDYMWDDALASKFGTFSLNSPYLSNDELYGDASADIISFPTRNDK